MKYADNLREATLRLFFDGTHPDGTPRFHMKGEIVLDLMGKEIRVDCNPSDVIEIHEALLLGEENREPSEESMQEEEAPPRRVVLGEAQAESQAPSSFLFSPIVLGSPTPTADKTSPRLPASPPRSVAKDEGGHPILSGDGVDPMEVMDVQNPGENGVDLL